MELQHRPLLKCHVLIVSKLSTSSFLMLIFRYVPIPDDYEVDFFLVDGYIFSALEADGEVTVPMVFLGCAFCLPSDLGFVLKISLGCFLN